MQLQVKFVFVVIILCKAQLIGRSTKECKSASVMSARVSKTYTYNTIVNIIKIIEV